MIHCVQGVSRSCTFAIAYLIWCYGISYSESYDIIRQARPIASPNTGFICQLLEWEKYRLFGLHQLKYRTNLITQSDDASKEKIDFINERRVKDEKNTDENLFEDEEKNFLREDTILGHRVNHHGRDDWQRIYSAKILRSSVDRSLSPLRKSLMDSESCYIIEVISIFYNVLDCNNDKGSDKGDPGSIHHMDRVLYIWIGKDANKEAISACKRHAKLILELEGRKAVVGYTLSPLCLQENDPKDEVYLNENIFGSKYNLHHFNDCHDKLKDSQHGNNEDECNTKDTVSKKKERIDQNSIINIEHDHPFRNDNNASSLSSDSCIIKGLETLHIDSKRDHKNLQALNLTETPRNLEQRSTSQFYADDFHQTTDVNIYSKVPFSSRGRIESIETRTKDSNTNSNEVSATINSGKDEDIDRESFVNSYENVKVEVYRIVNTDILRKEEMKKKGDNIIREIEWEKLGVYDDDDLEDDSVLFVYANNINLFSESSLWVGKDYCTYDTLDVPMDSVPRFHGINFDIAPVIESFKDNFDKKFNLHEFTNVIRAGEETDRFWSLFEAGY